MRSGFGSIIVLCGYCGSAMLTVGLTVGLVAGGPGLAAADDAVVEVELGGEQVLPVKQELHIQPIQLHIQPQVPAVPAMQWRNGRLVAPPGRAEAASPAGPAVYRIQWDDGNYLTYIGIEAGQQLRSRAWVATTDAESGELVVAYAGTAFRDADGEVHIDCRRTPINGPMASRWSPDSFAVADDGQVRVIDDADRGNPGVFLEQVLPDRVAEDGSSWAELLALSRSYALGRL